LTNYLHAFLYELKRQQNI